jgi:hypothetical protein
MRRALLSQRDGTAAGGHAFTQDSQRPSSLHPSSSILPVLQSCVAQTGLVLPPGDRPRRQPQMRRTMPMAKTTCRRINGEPAMPPRP